MLKKIVTLLCLSLLVFAAFGCAAPPAEESAEEAAPSGDVALKITGKVDKEMGWTEEEVHAMNTMESQSKNKEGEMDTYTGVSMNALLDMAGVGGDATTLVFVADDGYEAEVALADVQACDKCIVSFRTNGGFRTVLPEYPNNVQVKGVIEIKVK